MSDRHFRPLFAVTAAVISALVLFPAEAYSQTAETAKVPVISNVAASVSMLPPDGAEGIGMTRIVRAGGSGSRVDTLTLTLNKKSETASISHQRQRQNAPAAVTYGRGGVSLRLRTGSYERASVSLFSVDGRRVLHGKADAADGAFNLSRQNIAAGVYLLSVKGINNSQFAAKLSHNGGRLNINASFDDALTSAAPLGKSAKAAADGEWSATVSSPGYFDTSYTFVPVKGRNSPAHNITLRKRPSGGDLGIGTVGCSREGLANAANYLIAAIRAGDHTLMPLADNAKYIENDNSAQMNRNRTVDFGKGLWEKAINPDYYMNFLDVDSCATFSELIFATDDPQYINGVRVKVSGDKIAEVFAVVTKDGDWLFNAPDYVRYSAAEDWTELPPSQRLTRKELFDGAELYFAHFNDKNMIPPWGIPCARLEGGAYTGNSSTSKCDVGIPNTQKIPTIWHLADVDHGMVVLYLFFGGADTHMFRILKDHGTSGGPGYRYIHTLTAMKQSDFQGAPQ